MGRATVTSATSVPSFRNLATRSSARAETSEPSTPIRIRGAIRNRRYPSRPRPPAVSTKRSTFVESTTTLATPWRISHALDALRGDNVRAKATLGSRDGRETCERCGGDTMKITIIGAGNMGRAIGTRAIAGGHEVEILDRDPAEARALADQLGGSASVPRPLSGVRRGGRRLRPLLPRDQGGGPAVRGPGRRQGRRRHHEPGRHRHVGQAGHTAG